MKTEFTLNFIEKGRWKLLWNGLQNTLLITLVACLMGIAIGVVVATVRATCDKTGPTMHRGLPRTLLWIADRICRLYITVIRGTPVVIQLMIMYYVIFISSSNGVMVAMLAFGLNSGAYVSEIFRGGIMSIDQGQFEAGRSLGLNYVQTMIHIIAPQVLKTVL
ncbi:MAG: ABC transporter permease subunit, partial [Clostridia bacterium]|nr:ABC transporter permease subunit [Clostridia bacterium]